MGSSSRRSSSAASLHTKRTSSPFPPQSPEVLQKHSSLEPQAGFMKCHIIEEPWAQTFVLSPWKTSCSQWPTPDNTAGTLRPVTPWWLSISKWKVKIFSQHQESYSELHLRAQPELISEAFLLQELVLLLAVLTQGLCSHVLPLSHCFSSPRSKYLFYSKVARFHIYW